MFSQWGSEWFEDNEKLVCWEPHYEITNFGVVGIMPSNEKREFATAEEYLQAYRDEENEIADALAEQYANNFVEYPEDFCA